MNPQIICLVLLLTVGFSHGQSSMFNQFNPIADNSSAQNDNSTSETNNATNSTNDQNQQQQPNMGKTFEENNEAIKKTMNSMMNVGKAHVDAAKTIAETGIKVGNSFPQLGSKLMGQMSNSNSQKNGPMGGFGFFK
ncbi:uncharacterized protein LOC123258850 [Cotesia glomerata]|uniref:Uncharacterized protein n=1 Tax=Cotesia glomerata TaxID=32391 RepID=A0AAV7I016_COTGL|nr:uncharacterized protein LOC123258850 [Cotesia glomerata]KAH0539726.1 hypothetical protein KQX54_007630 [Cotesia glomerata]